MKVLQINTVYAVGSTGKIAKQIHDKCVADGHECLTAFRYIKAGEEFPDTLAVSSYLDCHTHNRIARYTMLQGFFSKRKTKHFIQKVRKYAPDIIHLHNLHGNYINLKLLFDYIRESSIPVVWSLHDCWSLTGGCAHFLNSGCTKWETGCADCPSMGNALFDNSAFMWNLKRKLYGDIKNLYLVTPSQWLQNIVKKSFLRKNFCQVINNGIDLSIFKPRVNNIRELYSVGGKFIILGVASIWEKRKGIDVFERLSNLLNSHFQIILVGKLPDGYKRQRNIIYIDNTSSQTELAHFYAASNVFLNPTREDNFPTVNIEALACGTPVLTTNVGGSAEMIDETCGKIINNEIITDVINKITDLSENAPYSCELCRLKALQYEQSQVASRYIQLYTQAINESSRIV